MRINQTISRISLRNLVFPGLILLTVSCSKTSSTPGNTTSSITSFSFTQSANSIAINSTAAISGSNITIFLPPGTNVNALKASYTLSDSGTVRVNGTAQQSNVTPNDFSAPVVYTVTSASGNVQTYTVNLITGIQAIDQNVSQFMTQYNVPGLSLAITLNDKLVYAKAYGLSSIEDNTVVSTNNLFRVSSLSKQITSVAIMKLMDQGKITMNQRVFGPGAILGTDYGTYPYQASVTEITVGELLTHTSGGWPDDTTDPLGKNPSLTAQQLVSWGIDNVPLIDTPGVAFHYSHFGYTILGRVIEKLTGLPYAQAVQSLVLTPSGISDMAIAGNTLAQRLPNEVKYYSQNQFDPYQLNINRMDAPNGWIASATDMARFLAHVDGLSSQTIISSNAVNVMSTGSSANPAYGCGWELNLYNWYHHGNLPGTGTTQAVTTQSGNFNYVILTNTDNGGNFSGDMDNIFWNALPNISSWPTYDLFSASLTSH